MPGTFLGEGLNFPVRLDANGRITTAKDEESVRQSILTILGTAKGERVMRPDFGCGIHDLVFSVNNAGTIGRVAGEVRRALLQWEPRIDILDVQVNTGSRSEELLIRIDYRVRSTNNAFNLVYPFYLERGVP